MRLNLGCCDHHLSGYTNVDRCEPADQIVDLTKPWPWKTSAVLEIIANDIIEHLPDKILTMNEAWRVLMPGGVFRILVPTTDGRGAWQDPTHVSYWNRNSFWYYEAGDPHRERFGKHYGVEARFKTVFEQNLVAHGGTITMLKIDLEAVK